MLYFNELAQHGMDLWYIMVLIAVPILIFTGGMILLPLGKVIQYLVYLIDDKETPSIIESYYLSDLVAKHKGYYIDYDRVNYYSTEKYNRGTTYDSATIWLSKVVWPLILIWWLIVPVNFSFAYGVLVALTIGLFFGARFLVRMFKKHIRDKNVHVNM